MTVLAHIKSRFEMISFIYGIGLWLKSIYLRNQIEYKFISKFVFFELISIGFFVFKYF